MTNIRVNIAIKIHRKTLPTYTPWDRRRAFDERTHHRWRLRCCRQIRV